MSDHHIIIHRLIDGGSSDRYSILGLPRLRKTDLDSQLSGIELERVMDALRRLNPDETAQKVWREVLDRTGTLILDMRQ